MRLQRLACGVLAVAVCLTMARPPLADDAPPIDPVPADNADLEDIQAKAEAALAFAGECAAAECPEFDCGAAIALLEALLDRRQLLQEMLPWLEKANDDHMAHFESLVEQGILTGESMANAQNALAWQEYLHGIGTALLDIADLKGIADSILEDPSKLTNENFEKLVNNLYRFDKAIKKTESLVSTTAGTPKPYAGLTPDVAGVTGSDINTMKGLSGEALGAIDSIKGGMEDALEEGLSKRDAWKKALSKAGGPRENLLSVLGTITATISEMEIAERVAHIESLQRDLMASDLAQLHAYRNLRRIQSRRFAAEDALAAVQAALGPLQACLSANDCVGATFTRVVVPDFADTAPDGTKKESWGKALSFFNQALSTPVPPVPALRDDCPTEPPGTIGFLPDWSVTFDSDVWCTYGGGTIAPTGGDGGDPSDEPGDDPRDLPGPGGGPGGGDPGDAPPPEDDGDDPRDAPGGAPTPGPTTTGEPPEDHEDDGDDPRDAPGPAIYVKAKRSVLEGTRTEPVAGALVKLNLDPPPALPVAGNPRTDAGYDEAPVQGVTDEQGDLVLDAPGAGTGALAGSGSQLELDLTPHSSSVVHLSGAPEASLHAGLLEYLGQSFVLGGTTYAVLFYPKERTAAVQELIALSDNVQYVEENYCRDKQGPGDPYFASRGSWGQDYPDQWAVQHAGITGGDDSAWSRLGPDPQPVIVAVIDSGLDWNHADLDWNRIWKNPGEIPDNGVDDDGNGYVDDAIGWNFFQGNHQPWDRDGHGTFVAGLIGAATDNGTGIAGINPHARIMPLKALNAFGHSRASFLAEAIVYAADHGARVINLSVGGKNVTRIEQKAIDYAHARGAVIVVASGNDGIGTDDYGPAGADGVLTVAATDRDDARAGFSNWGAAIDLAAPGVDVLSLRARRTDLMRDIPGVEYEPNAAFVGEDARYYRASGTSFAAPIVAGVASLLLSADPSLTNVEVERMLTQSARDIEHPGRDQYTGYGLVDARAALAADPDFYLTVAIHGVSVVSGDDGQAVQVAGTLDADELRGGRVELGAGEAPEAWEPVLTGVGGVRDGILGDIPAKRFRGAPVWTLRLVGEHADGTTREARFLLRLGG